MLRKLLASRYERTMGNGRTRPCLITCETNTPGDVDVELVVKFSAGCFEKEKNLAIEAIAAMLAADLGLPVPEPFLVEIDDAFLDSLLEESIKQHIVSSSRVAFGSRRLPDGFAVWPKEGRIPKQLTLVAAEVFIFDAIIANADRRSENPNCLSSGDAIAIFDHELTFTMKQLLFWKEPWMEEGFDAVCEDSNHIFSPCYFEEKPTDLSRFVSAWRALSEERFSEYCRALPQEWVKDSQFVEDIVNYLKIVRANIEKVVERGMEKLK